MDGVIVGTLTLVGADPMWGPQKQPAVYIQQLAVHHNYHRLHVGKYIIDAAAAEAKKYGCEFVRLTCSSDNKKLCKYYASLQFLRADRIARPTLNGPAAAFFQRPIE